MHDDNSVAERPLTTYLDDHYAGPAFAAASAKQCADTTHDRPLAEYLHRFVAQLGAERAQLRAMLAAFGARPSASKQIGAWLAEKAHRVKMRAPFGRRDALGTFETLETLRLGVQGKRGLWTFLASREELLLRAFDLTGLILAADEQIDELERFRIAVGQRLR